MLITRTAGCSRILNRDIILKIFSVKTNVKTLYGQLLNYPLLEVHYFHEDGEFVYRVPGRVMSVFFGFCLSFNVQCIPH